MTVPVSFCTALKVAGLAATLLFSTQLPLSAQQAAASHQQFLNRYCTTCHNDQAKSGGLSLVRVDLSRPGAQPELWEKVVRKVRTGVMPPPNVPQPSDADRLATLKWLESSLDAASSVKLNPGRTETLRRLNRTEYQNAIRDLLALDIDAASLLPADESGHGYDNINLGDLSATLLNRYISAAQKISRLAVGSTQSGLQNDVIGLPADLTQEDQLPGLPLGTRGGVSTSYTFPQDGEYDIQISLMRDLAGVISGLRDSRSHEMLLLIDREPVQSFSISREALGDKTLNEKALKARIAVKAGPHNIAVTFVKNGSSLIDTPRLPTQSRFNDRRHPRTAPAIDQISITGPHAPKGAGETPSRRRLFVCRPTAADKAQEEKCAGEILSTLVRRAYRRPIAKADVDGPMAFYRQGRAGGDFDSGITTALTAVLTNPEFLFRVESDPKKIAAGGVYRINDLELASRLSFFLWSSIPDDELLDAAIRGKLSQPAELEKQTRRMLADRRSFNLATNFAGQWLRLRNIDAVNPSGNLFRDFDDNLRQAFRQETESFFDSVLREDRSVLTFRLHISQRTARETLRNLQRLREPHSPRGTSPRQQARRTAAPGQRAVGHLVCHADIASAPRSAGAAQHHRRAATCAPAERTGSRREHHGRQSFHAAETGRAQEQRSLRELPSDNRSRRLFARKLRCRGALARPRGGRSAGRLVWRHTRRQGVPWDRWTRGSAAAPSRTTRRNSYGEPVDVRTRARR
jgi:mono/diheme cytochrome c family protein